MNYQNWPYTGVINYKALAKAQRQNVQFLDIPRYAKFKKALEAIKPLAAKIKKKSDDNFFKVENSVIKIGRAEQFNSEELKLLQSVIKAMVPWRKGPFELFGELIDAEWRSDLKWQRVKRQVGPLQGKIILDIGCNNGYYLYHMASQKPKYVLGIDPVISCYYQNQLLNQFYKPACLDFRLLGVEDLVHFERNFDFVFCMGILYHHPDPIGILRMIFNCLKPGGLLIVESQGIQKEGAYCLFPKNRYLKTPGHWFIPSREALENMLHRSGFQYIETFEEIKLDSNEQRSSKDSPFDSLYSGLDPVNPELSAEGYPAPWRFYVKARRARLRR